MDSSVAALSAFFESRRAHGEPLVLATVIATQGSTYRKAGARMLFARDGGFAGLLSGGCLETDLHQQALDAIAQRRARAVDYDARGSDDLIWGLGLGCEGAMRILLQPAIPATGYEPLPRLVQSLQLRQRETFATIVSSHDSAWPAGRCWFAEEPADSPIACQLAASCASALRDAQVNRVVRLGKDDGIEAFIGALEPPTRVLLLGGGPDALAVINQAALLGWAITVVDHRPAYADAARLAAADHVILAQPQELALHVRVNEFDAAVVMSHHLPSDLAYLQGLALTDIRYVGLLGPAARRERLRADLGDARERLEGRLYGPVGLDIGAATPEAIALAIVGEIHAVLSDRDGRSFSTTVAR
jgi:xanthine dehydrogenase accessory factor